jgi:hypothetical protein
MVVVTMPPHKGSPSENRGARKSLGGDYTNLSGLSPVGARAVSWWSVVEFVEPYLQAADSWPMAGSPAWCALGPDDPAKVAALYDAAQHHILRVETAQQAMCEASEAISAAEDWTAVASSLRTRREWLDAHPWAKRGAA